MRFLPRRGYVIEYAPHGYRGRAVGLAWTSRGAYRRLNRIARRGQRYGRLSRHHYAVWSRP